MNIEIFTMTEIKSKINQLKARIDQYRNSGLFSDEKAAELIKPLQKELDGLLNEINVTTTEL